MPVASRETKVTVGAESGAFEFRFFCQAFARLDADGSGDLTWDEFVAGSKRIVVPPETAIGAENKAAQESADAAAKVQASIRGRNARAKKMAPIAE